MISKGNLTEQELESYYGVACRNWEKWAQVFRFTGNEHSVVIDVLKHYSFNEPGTYTMRIGYWVYPETRWNDYCRTLTPRICIWSNEFVVCIDPVPASP